MSKSGDPPVTRASGTARELPAWRRTDVPIRLGVSSCLLGQRVRYDGGHKRNLLLTDLLGAWFEWVPVCPEIELGLGVPRPSLRLERAPASASGASETALRMIRTQDGHDLTSAMQRFARRRARELERADLSGYVLKKDSPSCGMERVKVYGANGPPRRDGSGLFASALARRLPLLPIEEEGRLSDLSLRESFIERVFAYHRLKSLFASRWSLAQLIDFHTVHKLELMAHCPASYRTLGRLVATGRDHTRAELRDAYCKAFMAALARPATRARHVNVLEHMAGYLRRGLTREARGEVSALIADYRAGLVPLVVPITLLKHHIRALGIDYLQDQVYLDPHPKELMLRNHA